MPAVAAAQHHGSAVPIWFTWKPWIGSQKETAQKARKRQGFRSSLQGAPYTLAWPHTSPGIHKRTAEYSSYIMLRSISGCSGHLLPFLLYFLLRRSTVNEIKETQRNNWDNAFRSLSQIASHCNILQYLSWKKRAGSAGSAGGVRRGSETEPLQCCASKSRIEARPWETETLPARPALPCQGHCLNEQKTQTNWRNLEKTR